jgi:hypothetical protein
MPAERGSSGTYWTRSAPAPASRAPGSYSNGYGRGSSSRPQLDMRQPIARSPYGASPRGGYGGYHGAPSYGGSHSAPSSGGGHVSAPSGGGHAPSGGGGGGHSGGGGHR